MRDTLRDGLRALSEGRIAAASDCARRVLQANGNLAEGHFLVGLIAVEARQLATAISAFGSVTRLDPRHGAAWAQLAKLFFTIGQPLRADNALAEAVANESGDPVVQDLIGVVHTLLGDTAEAATWFTKAVSASPDNVMFLVNHANNEMYLGNLQAAESALHRALELHPRSPQAHWVLSSLRKAVDDRHAAELRRLTADPGTPPQSQAFLYYALGKELEDLEQWDEAFEAFRRGAEARRQLVDFDEAAEERLFAALTDTFDSDWLASRGPGHAQRGPVFIVGQPRTGTTLIERIITSHSQLHSAGELRQFGNSLRRLTDYRGHGRNSAELVAMARDMDVAALGRAYMDSTERMRGDAAYFVDKLPPNYLYLPLILAALPNARIIHVRRNPMDACFASFKQLFADAYPHSYTQEEMARHHARYYHLMQHYREQFAGRYFEVSYEDTATDTEASARALVDFLELPWEDACLDFHRQKVAVTTASSVQVRQPAHTRSIDRWRRYERQLLPMRRALEERGVDAVPA